MFMRVASILLALAVAVMVSGCGKAPQDEMNVTEDALSNAQAAEAQAYAPASYQQALDSLNAAKVEIQNQDSKFALFRGYGRSEELLAASKSLAEKAVADAQAAKEQVRLEDSVLMIRVDSLFTAARAALRAAPTGKGTKADIELIKSDLASVQQTYATVAADYNAGKYLVVKSKLEAASTQLNRIIAEIAAARAKASGKR
jgi:hypothetical protein